MDRAESVRYYIENPDGINDVSKPYACFHYGIQWLPEVIADYDGANGYIVQKIRIKAPDFLSGYPCKKYYEAWEVKNGTVRYPEPVSKKEDDVFEYPSEGISESLFKGGSIEYYADVYWIDKESSCYSIVDKWDLHAVQQAGSLLKSSEISEKIDTLIPVFTRKPFVFSFDFSNKEDVCREILRIGRNAYSCERCCERENFKEEYRDQFIKHGKKSLFLNICQQLDSEYN